MARQRPRTPQASAASSRRFSSPGTKSREGLINSLPHVAEDGAAAKARRDAIGDLLGSVLVGPPGPFPLRPSTARALFDLALDRLARHDKTTADALNRYAAQLARSELQIWAADLQGLSPAEANVATLKWLASLLATPMTEDLRKGFDQLRLATGKRTCHPRTLRRQYVLLRAYGRAHDYPNGARRNQRQGWAREHLRAMIAEAQTIPCWHSPYDLTDEELDKVVKDVQPETQLTEVSAWVLGKLHLLSPISLRKRLLFRPR